MPHLSFLWGVSGFCLDAGFLLYLPPLFGMLLSSSFSSNSDSLFSCEMLMIRFFPREFLRFIILLCYCSGCAMGILIELPFFCGVSFFVDGLALDNSVTV